MVDQKIPEKGDIVLINLDPQSGREQAGKRPALVLSPLNYNKKVGLALLAPITNQIKNYPFEVELPDNLNTKGAILSDHIKSLDWKKREAKFLEKIPQTTLNEVIHKLLVLLS